MAEFPTFKSPKLNQLVEAIKQALLESQGQSVQRDDQIGEGGDIYDRVFIGEASGDGTWKEKAVVDGDVVDYGTPGTDGRHCASTGDPSKAVVLNGKQVVMMEVTDPPDSRYLLIPTPRLGKITVAGGAFPTFDYTVQLITGYDSGNTGHAKWTTDGVDITGAKNRAEFAPAAGYPYTYGNGSNITASDGTVDSGSCVIIPIGVGAVVDLTFGLDENGDVLVSFCAMNSAEAP